MNDPWRVPASYSREELRRRRVALGLTQQRLADALGLSNQTISRWETGLNPYIPPWVEKALLGLETEKFAEVLAKQRREMEITL